MHIVDELTSSANSHGNSRDGSSIVMNLIIFLVCPLAIYTEDFIVCNIVFLSSQTKSPTKKWIQILKTIFENFKT